MSENSRLASPNEYQWQQMCYERLFDLLGPQYPVVVEKSAAEIGGSGRMDVCMPTLKWILEYVQNATAANANEHHQRLEEGGKKYFTSTTKQYRVIDFKGNVQNTFKTAGINEERLNHHVTVWVTVGCLDVKLPGTETNQRLPFASIADDVVTKRKCKCVNAKHKS